MTVRTVTRLLPDGAVVHGSVEYDGRDVSAMSAADLRRYRDRDVGVVFQDPRAHINPTHRVGEFLTEALTVNRGMAEAEASNRVAGLLAAGGIDDPARRPRQYSHQPVRRGLPRRVDSAGAGAEAEP